MYGGTPSVLECLDGAGGCCPVPGGILTLVRLVKTPYCTFL